MSGNDLMIWDRSSETQDRDDLAQVQLERLQASLFRAFRNVSFYRKRFDDMHVAPEDIQTLVDLRHLPFTTIDDLRQGYPYDLLAVPLREVVRLHHASTTSGRPTVCAFTRNDLRHWHDRVARLLAATGITHDDVVQFIYSAESSAGNLGFHGGAERIGASVIPAAFGNVPQQIAIMQDFRSTALVGAASATAHLAQTAGEMGLDLRRLSARVAVLGGEPWPESLRQTLHTVLGVTAFDHYSLSEFGGPGIAGECVAHNGLHVVEDHFLAEVVDPESGAPVADGEEGELVLTSLTREALPLIRFRTRDLTRLDTRPCACGRTLVRMARVSRRTDNLLFVRGRTLPPALVGAILAEIEGGNPRYLIVVERKGGLDDVEILVELVPGQAMDSPGKILALEQRIRERLHEQTDLSPHIRLVESHTLDTLAADVATRVIDRRE